MIPVITTPAETNAPWSDDEIRVLRAYYATESIAQLGKLLPGRAHTSIYSQAHKVGLRKGGYQVDRWRTNEGLQGITKIALAHKTKKSVADAIGIHVATLDKWLRTHDDIRQAFEVGPHKPKPRPKPKPKLEPVTRVRGKCAGCGYKRALLPSGKLVYCILLGECSKEGDE